MEEMQEMFAACFQGRSDLLGVRQPLDVTKSLELADGGPIADPVLVVGKLVVPAHHSVTR